MAEDTGRWAVRPLHSVLEDHMGIPTSLAHSAEIWPQHTLAIFTWGCELDFIFLLFLVFQLSCFCWADRGARLSTGVLFSPIYRQLSKLNAPEPL